LIVGAIVRPRLPWPVGRWLVTNMVTRMKTPLRRTALPLAALVLVSAAPVPEDWLRRGNDALARGQYDTALACFARAAERTTDPGQVAFNEGVAQFGLGRHRDADLSFRRCLSDAAGERRTKGLYNLGCTLLQESEGRHAAPLREAVGR